MTALRIVLLGDGAWAADTLDLLATAGHCIAGVVARTSPSDAALEAAALRHGVPALRPASINAVSSRQALADLAPDLMVSVAYDQILRAPVRGVAPRGAINAHAGMLPNYRGRNVINWALINGETEIGLTTHFMDDGIDTGDIILQHTLPVGWTDVYGDVLARVVAALPALVRDTVALIAAGSPPTRPQRHLRGSYFGGRGAGDEWLDWSATSASLHNKVRAISHPAPGARTSLGGRTITVWKAFYDQRWPSYVATPGQVVGREPGGVLVKTGDSTLLVETVAGDDGTPRRPDWPIGTRLDVNPLAATVTRLAQADPLSTGGRP